MSRAWLRVAVDKANDAAFIQGPGAGRLIEQASGKLIWLPRRRAWATSVRVASAVLALADHERRVVTYTEAAA